MQDLARQHALEQEQRTITRVLMRTALIPWLPQGSFGAQKKPNTRLSFSRDPGKEPPFWAGRPRNGSTLAWGQMNRVLLWGRPAYHSFGMEGTGEAPRHTLFWWKRSKEIGLWDMHKWERLELELADRSTLGGAARHIVNSLFRGGYVDVINLGLATPFRTCKKHVNPILCYTLHVLLRICGTELDRGIRYGMKKEWEGLVSPVILAPRGILAHSSPVESTPLRI